MFQVDLPFSLILSRISEEIIEHNITDKIVLNKIGTDSRKLTGGEFFIALKGETFDGHQFIKEVIDKNLVQGVIFDTGAIHEKIFYIKVKDTNHFFLKLAQLYREEMNPLIVGITGSNGKTSTKELTAFLLEKILDPKSVMKTKKNLNNHFGVPYTLFSLKKETQVGVVELGMNHPGEIEILSEIVRPDICVITSISEGHAEFFESINDIAKEKFSILKGCRGKGILITHPEIIKKYKTILNQSFLDHDLHDLNETKKQFLHSETEIGFQINSKIDNSISEVKILASHQRKNFLLALAVLSYTAEKLEIPIEKIDFAIKNLNPLPQANHRLSQVKTSCCEIWDDTYNANPDSFKMAIDFISSRKADRRIGIFGQMSELGKFALQKHRWLGNYAKEKGFTVALFASQEKEYQEAFSSGWDQAGPYLGINPHENELKEALEELKKYVSSESIILFKGSRSVQMERGIDIFLDLFSDNSINNFRR